MGNTNPKGTTDLGDSIWHGSAQQSTLPIQSRLCQHFIRPFGLLDVGCRHFCTKLGNLAIQREPRLRDLIVRLALSLFWLRLDDLIVHLTLSLAWLRHDQQCYESAEGQKDKHLSQNGYRNRKVFCIIAMSGSLML